METVLIYNENCVLAGRVCHKQENADDCTEYSESDVSFAKWWLSHHLVKNSGDLFESRKFRNIIKHFEGEIRNIRMGKKS